MANNKDFILKNPIEIGGPTKSVLGTSTSNTTYWDFNIGTNASYDNISFNVGSQESNPAAITFDSTGLYMYAAGATSDRAYRYKLTKAFDLSTAVYDNYNMVLNNYVINPTGITFGSNGSKFYALGLDPSTGNDYVIVEYTLSTPYSLNSSSYTRTVTVLSVAIQPWDLTFNPDGTKLYLTTRGNNRIYEYPLSTAWDLSSLGALNYSYTFTHTAYSTVFKSDGTEMYVLTDTTLDSVRVYGLSTPWDASTASLIGFTSVASQVTKPYNLYIVPNGTKMYVMNNDDDTIYQYSISEATQTLDISSGNYFVSEITAENEIINFNNADDSQVFKVEISQGYIPYSISTTSYSGKSFDVSSEGTSVTGLTFKPDGTLMYVQNSISIDRYSLSTPWDISTASFVTTSSVFGPGDTLPEHIAFKSDGTRLYMIGRSNDVVYSFTVNPAWTGSPSSSVSFSVAAQEAAPYCLAFGDDGAKMFVAGLSDYVYEYDLSTAWDITTAAYSNTSFYYGGEINNAYGMAFNPDGTKMILHNGSSLTMVSYDLSTAWDLSTASFSYEAFSISEDTSPRQISVDDTGRYLYIAGDQTDTIYQYDTLSSKTITWPTSIEWDSGVTPAAPNIGETDIFTFITANNGVSYIGLHTADNLS